MEQFVDGGSWTEKRFSGLLVAQNQLFDAFGQWVVVAPQVFHDVKVIKPFHFHQLHRYNASFQHLKIDTH